MTDDANKQTENDFALKAATSLVGSRTAQGAGIGAGVLLILGMMFGPEIGKLKNEVVCGGVGAGIGASFGLAIGMKRKSEILEDLLKHHTPEKTAGSGPIPPAI